MYPTVSINGQRVNLSNVAGFAAVGTDVVFNLHGGMDEGESPYILVKTKSKDEQTQLLNFLDQQMKTIDFVPIID